MWLSDLKKKAFEKPRSSMDWFCVATPENTEADQYSPWRPIDLTRFVLDNYDCYSVRDTSV